jgi:hypothetical protein
LHSQGERDERNRKAREKRAWDRAHDETDIDIAILRARGVAITHGECIYRLLMRHYRRLLRASEQRVARAKKKKAKVAKQNRKEDRAR